MLIFHGRHSLSLLWTVSSPATTIGGVTDVTHSLAPLAKPLWALGHSPVRRNHLTSDSPAQQASCAPQ